MTERKKKKWYVVWQFNMGDVKYLKAINREEAVLHYCKLIDKSFENEVLNFKKAIIYIKLKGKEKIYKYRANSKIKYFIKAKYLKRED